LNLVVYVSMAFGNPYIEDWSVEEVANACDRLCGLGVRQVSLADTVGLATPTRISETVACVLGTHHDIEIGVHLHARPDGAAEKIRAAYEAGCRRFDAAIGGFGGCPFAQDALVGNIATETLLAELNLLGAKPPDLLPLDDLSKASMDIARIFGTCAQQPA
jgi:hydroxymethylglutaryl-CoA lyase